MAEKFKDTIITDDGRHLLLAVGGGEGTLTYTRAVLSSQDVTGVADEDIRAIKNLSDNLMQTTVSVSQITDNTLTIVASFNNRDLTNDINFNAVGWYAKTSKDDKEILLGITPTAGVQTVAAGSPDHRSTESVEVDLNMAISNAAKVDLTVNEAGVVHHSDLEYELTKVKNDFDKMLADYTYDKATIDKKIASANIDISKSGAIVDINNIKPDGKGHFDFGNISYTKAEIDALLKLKANNQDVYDRSFLDNKFAIIAKQQQDQDNRIKQLEERPYFLTKHFAKGQDAQASQWESQDFGNRMAIVDD